MSGKNIPKGWERNWSHKGKHMVENQKILHWVPTPKLTVYSDARWGETAVRQSGCSLYEMKTIFSPCSTFYNNPMRNCSSQAHMEPAHPPSQAAQGRFSPPRISCIQRVSPQPPSSFRDWRACGRQNCQTSKPTCRTPWLVGREGRLSFDGRKEMQTLIAI